MHIAARRVFPGVAQSEISLGAAADERALAPFIFSHFSPTHGYEVREQADICNRRREAREQEMRNAFAPVRAPPAGSLLCFAISSDAAAAAGARIIAFCAQCKQTGLFISCVSYTYGGCSTDICN